MVVLKTNHVKEIMIYSIIIIILHGLITSTCGSVISESKLDTSSNISKLTDMEIKTTIMEFNKIDDNLKTIGQLFKLQYKESTSRKVRSTSYNISSPPIFSLNNSKHVRLTDHEIKNIIQEFNEINDELNSIQKSFRKQSTESKSRMVRSVERSKCTVSKQKLTNLKNEIESILSKVSSDNTPCTCNLNLNDPDNCNELTKVIQCGIQHLKNGFVDAVTSANESIEEIMQWKNAYDSLIDNYQKQSDELKQALSNEYQLKLDKLQTDMQKLGTKLNKALERLQTTTINLCVSEIMLGKFDEAVTHFQELKSISISVIIKECYNFQNDNNELHNFQNIINFIKQPPLISNIKVAYETLYKEMETKHHLGSLKITLLAWAIKNSPEKNNLTNLYSKVEFYLNRIKDLWADVIYHNRQDKTLINYATINQFFFSDILRAALKKPNALTDKFDNVIQFIKRLPKINQWAIAYSILSEEMHQQGMGNSNRMTKLAFNVKQSMEQSNYQNIEEIYKKMFEDVKRKLPSWARTIIWKGDKCKLRNRKWNQYMYANGGFEIDSERRRVFSRQLDTLTGIMEAESQWKFETDDGGESFMLKNVRWNEYLYASSDFSFCLLRRQVFTWRPGSQVIQGSWKITSTGNGNYITIQNINNKDEYLYGSGMFEWIKLRRRVFTWKLGKPQGEMFRKSEWNLEC